MTGFSESVTDKGRLGSDKNCLSQNDCRLKICDGQAHTTTGAALMS